MWEIPLGGFHLSNDVLHLSHKVDAGLFTWIITRVNTGQETGVSPLTTELYSRQPDDMLC